MKKEKRVDIKVNGTCMNFTRTILMTVLRAAIKKLGEKETFIHLMDALRKEGRHNTAKGLAYMVKYSEDCDVVDWNN